jgi:GTP-binding protein
VDDNYKRYLEKRLREAFDFTGTPIVLKFRSKD